MGIKKCAYCGKETKGKIKIVYIADWFSKSENQSAFFHAYFST